MCVQVPDMNACRVNSNPLKEIHTIVGDFSGSSTFTFPISFLGKLEMASGSALLILSFDSSCLETPNIFARPNLKKIDGPSKSSTLLLAV